MEPKKSGKSSNNLSSKDERDYDALVLDKKRIKEALDNPEFDQFVFAFRRRNKASYYLTCGAYNKSKGLIGETFSLKPAPTLAPKSLKNHQRGILILNREMMKHIKIDGMDNLLLNPEPYSGDYNGEFVKYSMSTNGINPAGDLDPSPPARFV